MAMGKLGGEELNFSSDIDVCYFYSTDAGAAAGEQLTLHQYYAELSRRVTAAIEEPTADGMIFRVDLRLRPEGRSGPLCNSLPAAERYYETFGRTWERQAWLRARPAAGDRALGDELLAALEPFIYPRSVEPAHGRRGARAAGAVPRSGRRAGALGETGFDVKLGSGGIRDVEMVVQALQLLHAGKRPDLRERNTPRALPRWWWPGCSAIARRETLLAAYRFWRRLEHRVQVATGAQRHRLPATTTARARFARGLGFADLAAFDAEVAATRAAVEAIAATLGEPPPEAHLAAARLLDPMRDRGELERRAGRRRLPRRRGGGRHAGAGRRAHAGGVPRGGDRLARSRSRAGALPRPGAARLGRPDGAAARPAAAGAHAGDAVRHQRSAGRAAGPPPGDVGAVRRRAGRAGPLGARSSPQRLAARLAGDWPRSSDDEETALRAIRRFQAEEILRIGLHDVAGSLQPAEVSAQLTDLAEVCLRGRDRGGAAGARGARMGKPRTALTVLGLGSLGAREMRYGSDLDLVFLYGADGESDTGVDHREWFARASQRLIATMEAMLEEGRLYQVDTRLRPSGEQGLLVTSWTSFERYHREEAAAWERVALLRARVVWSDETAAARAARERALAALAFDLPLDDAGFRADLRRVRGRVERERGKVPAGSRHLRFDPGRDHGRRVPGRARPAAPRRRPGAPHHVDGGGARAAGRARLAGGAARRLRGPAAGGAAAAPPARSPAGRRLAARSAGAGPQPGDDRPTLLAAELDERMARVRARVREVPFWT